MKAEKSKRGFASMTPERRQAIASMGGKKCQELGVAHKWNAETGRAASYLSHLTKRGKTLPK